MIKIEKIEALGSILVCIVRNSEKYEKTQFITPGSANMQVGHVVYPAGSVIKRHIHKKIVRKLDRTEEVLVVLEGSCEMDIYDNQKKLAATRKINKGDVIIIFEGGHGFRVIKDLVFLEIKQGPYTGVEEKERF